MRTTRTIAVLATIALALGACSGGSDDEIGNGTGEEADLPECPLDALDAATGPVDVVVWHTQTARPLETLQALVDEYNASQSKVRVSLEAQGASYEELQTKFTSAIPSKQLPALIVVDDTFTQTMADSGVVLPAQSCVEAAGYDMSDFVETAVSYYTVDGVLWPASANLGNALLFYNRDHFVQAGLDPDQPPGTLAEVRAAAETLQAAGVADKPLVHEFASWKTEFLLTGDKSSVVDNDNGRSGDGASAATLADNPQATELFSWFQQMLNDGLMAGIPAVPGQIDQYLALANRTSSMLIETSSAATSIEAFLGGELDTSTLGSGDLGDANVAGLEIGAAPMPGITTPGRTQMGGAAWYMMNTTPPEVQAGAWDFMAFMNAADAQGQMLIGGSYLPYRISTNDLPEVMTFYTDSLSGRWLEIANDEVSQIDPTFPGPLIGPYDEFRDALRRAQDELILNGMSPTDALAQAQADVDAAITRYNESSF